MSQPDLSRRVDRIEVDLAAVADTVVEIKETVGGHTRELGEIRQEQERQARTLAEHGQQLTGIQQTLATILQRLHYFQSGRAGGCAGGEVSGFRRDTRY